MSDVRYAKERTPLLSVGPYNDFLSDGGRTEVMSIESNSQFSHLFPLKGDIDVKG
jgi:hypothetical protein